MKNNLSSLRPSVVTTLIWTAFLSRTRQNSIVAGKELFDDHIDKTLGLQPKFDSVLSNISVVSGYTAVLPCSIENLGKFKVAWLDPSSMALTYEDRRVVDDTRFIVVRPNIQDWHLQVRETRIEDTGSYRCTVNTHQVKSKTINLFVKEPPRLLDSSKGQTVSEGSNVFLFCNFTGVPRPVVRWSWKNLLDESLVIRDVWKIPSDVQEQQCPTSSKTAATVLEVRNISRHCTGYFICMADNQVGQIGRKFIPVNVEFAPEVFVTNKRIGQYRNKETILECQIFAHPLGLTFWQKDGEKVEGRTDRRTEVFEHFVGRDDAPRSHRRHITISLRIFITNDDDYGTYRCIAENSLGNNSDETVLHEIKEAPRKASQSSTENILVDGKRTKAKQAKQNDTLPAYRTEAINFRQVLSDELKSRLGVSEASPSLIFLGPHSGIILVWMLYFVFVSRK